MSHHLQVDDNQIPQHPQKLIHVSVKEETVMLNSLINQNLCSVVVLGEHHFGSGFTVRKESVLPEMLTTPNRDLGVDAVATFQLILQHRVG